MTTKIDTLKYDLSLETSKYDAAIDRSHGKASKFDGAMVKLKGTFASLAPAAAALAGTAAMGGLVSIMADGVKSAAEWERRLLRTESLVRATGNAAGLSATELSDFAKQMDLATLGDRDGILDAINGLQTFRSVQGDVFKDAIRLSGDLSEVLGVDMASQAVQLGKALEDPIKGITALRRVGVSFTDDQKKVIKTLYETGRAAEAQREILNVLEQQVGGAATGAASGLSGKVDTLNYRWREFKETLAGSKPVLDLVGSSIDKLSGTLEKLSNIDFTDLAEAATYLGNFLPGASILGLAIGKAGQNANQDVYGLGQYGEFGNPINAMRPEDQQGPKDEARGLFGGDPKDYQDLWMSQAEEKWEVLKRSLDTELEIEAEHIEASKALQKDFWQLQIAGREEVENRAIKLIQQRKAIEVDAAMTAIDRAKYALKSIGKDNELAYKAYQALAIGQATISGIKAAVEAWDAGMSIGGWYAPIVAAAYAGASLAWTGAQIQAIKSGGKSQSPSGVTTTVGAFRASPDTGLPTLDPAVSDERRGELHVHIDGPVIGDEQYINDLVEKINKAGERDVYIHTKEGA